MTTSHRGLKWHLPRQTAGGRPWVVGQFENGVVIKSQARGRAKRAQKLDEIVALLEAEESKAA
jgi:hypothetical protein